MNSQALGSSMRGFILLPVMLGLALLAAIALIMNREGAGLATQGDADFQAQQARYLAEAALEQQTWRLQKSNCAGYTNLAATSLGADSYSATVSAVSGSPVAVTATGTTNSGASRTLTRKVKVYKTATQNVVLQPDSATGQDGWIEATNNTRNHGAQDLLQVSADSVRSLIKFDLTIVPKHAKVASASLGLYAISGSTAGDVFVRPITRDWSEGSCSGGGGCTADGATWDTYDGSKNWATAGGDFYSAPIAKTTLGASSSVWYAWDVTDLTADWVSGDQLNYGALITGSGSAGASFASSDNSTIAFRPKLTLNYVCECGQVCFTPSKPIARWKLDETSGTSVADTDGGHTGSLVGGTWMTGQMAGGLYLNGTNSQYVSVPNAADLSLTSYTLSAWIKPSSLSTDPNLYRSVVSKGTSGNNFQYNLAVVNKQINFGWNNGALFYEFQTTTANLQNNVWYHVAGSYDAATKQVNVYLNGTALLTKTATIGPAANTEGVRIGSSAWGEYWLGGLDDVRIYNAVLVPAEISQIASDGGAGQMPGSTTVTLNPTADTFVRQDKSTTKYGSTTPLDLGGTNGISERRILLSFNVTNQIPPGAKIQSAMLKLNESIVASGGAFITNAYRVTSSWTENSATWVSSAAIYNPTILSSATVNDATGWKSWNVTALVQEWTDRISTEYGIALIRAALGTQIPQFVSKEGNSSSMPQLVITYQ